VDVLGPVRYKEAVEEFNGYVQVRSGGVTYGLAGSVQRKDGEERSGEVWRGRNLQRCGGDGTHVECLGKSRWGQEYGRMGIEKVRQGEAVRDTARCWRGVEAFGLAGSVQRIGRVHLVRKDGVWQSRSGEVSFGEAWLGRFALERIGLDRQVRDRNGKAGNVRDEV
jgi:hypothetical protein